MNRRRKHSGFSLVELMVVISVSSTLMVVAVGWIHQSLKLGSVIRGRQHHHQSLLRLSRQLRDDVHRGKAVTMQGENKLVISVDEEQTVTYEIIAGAVTRLAREADALVSQESFGISPKATARWESGELPDWVSLVVDRSRGTPMIPNHENVTEGATDPMPADLHVRVAVGRLVHLAIDTEVAP